MTELLIFRHAKAVRSASGGDKDRPLEKKGRAAAERMGSWMREKGLAPELALVSDARRTRETFAYAAKEFGSAIPARNEPAIYEADVETLLRLVRKSEPNVRSILLIGHNPGLADLASLLADRGDRMALSRLRAKFPTSAIAQLSCDGSWRDWRPGAARLIDFVTPASLNPGEEEDD